jgi:hypothetical protein
MSIKDSGLAFPNGAYSGGMTFRQYAAIKLKVPDSGVSWLDDMIRKANRKEYAGQALVGLANEYDAAPNTAARLAFEMADAMVKVEGQ